MSTVFKTGLYNPDILSCIANLSNDEVFTPPEIANALLDTLPQDIFSDPTISFLDPACKSGVILREAAKRFIKGLEKEIPDLQERVNHIYRNQLFGIGITELTSLLSRRSLYCSKYPNSEFSVCKFNTVEGNIRFRRISHQWKGNKCALCGAKKEIYDRGDSFENHAYEFIHNEAPEIIFNRKFDVIVSNPPYGLSDGGGGSGKSTTPIYHRFVIQAIKMNPQYIAMIIPSRWFSGGKGLDEFREQMLNDSRITSIVDYADSKDCFSSGVDIPGGICYFQWNRNHNGPCKITNILKQGEKNIATRPLNEFTTFIRLNKAVEIVKKVLSKDEVLMNEIVLSRKPFGISSDVPFDRDGDVLYRNSKGMGAIDHEKITTGIELVGKWKTIISKVTTEHAGVPDKSGRMRVLAAVETLEPNAVCSESYLVTGSFDTEEQANNMADYLKTKFVRFLLMQMLASMNMSRNTFSFVPMQDFNLSWSDDDLYQKYNLSKDEIQLIETTMKPMGEN